MAAKQEHLERRRLAQFDRDVKRWEFMEKHEQDNDRREEIRRNKYRCGLITGSSNGYDILNAQYDPGYKGNMLKQAEAEKEVRDAIRNRNLELNWNAHFDIFNGKPRNLI